MFTVDSKKTIGLISQDDWFSSGVNVPGIRMVDATEGILGIQWIEGQSVRKLLPGGAEDDGADNVDSPDVEDSDPLTEYGVSVGTSVKSFCLYLFLTDRSTHSDEVMNLIGNEIAKMHRVDVIHGDLTTSNMMLRHPKSFVPFNPNVTTELVRFMLLALSALVRTKLTQ